MLEIGQIIDGKYKILNVIGKGGMSVVYLAMNERANKQWAIKEVRKDGTQDFNVVRQGLVAEIDMLKRFNHPNLPSIVDVIDGNGSFLIVMDYIEGIALDKKLQEEGALPQSSVIEWSKQLCDVLGYLHSRKPPIIYRDMKPANVMLKPDNTITLIDFGTAREFKLSSVEDTTVLGTRGYAAPEQYGGQGQTDPRTDIYCLGATMYHLVTGYNPAVPPYEMVPIRQINELLSSGLEAIILKCTRPNPPDRYQSCAELMYALEHYQELDAESQHIQNVKWRSFIAAASLAVVTLIGGVGFNIAKNIQTNSSYDSYVNKITSVQDTEESYDLARKAIKLQPDRYEAYDKLNERLMFDGKIDYNEYRILSELTINKTDLEEEAPELYSYICYKYATNIFLNCDVDGTGFETIAAAKQSLPWFNGIDLKTINSIGKEKGEKNPDNMSTKAEILNALAVFKTAGKTDDIEMINESWDNYINLFTTSDIINESGKYSIPISIYSKFVTDVTEYHANYVQYKDAATVIDKLEYVEGQLNTLEGLVNNNVEQIDRINSIRSSIAYAESLINSTEGGTVQ